MIKYNNININFKFNHKISFYFEYIIKNTQKYLILIYFLKIILMKAVLIQCCVENGSQIQS